MRTSLVAAVLALSLAPAALAKNVSEMSMEERMAFATAIMVCDDERYEPDKRVDACTIILRLKGDNVGADTTGAYYAYRGNAHRELGNYDDAMDDYKDAIKMALAVAEAYGGRALLHRTLHKQTEAIADANKAVELEPKNPMWLSVRALVLSESAPDKALADIEQMLTLVPDAIGARAVRASILVDLGQYDRAIADTTKALELNPNFAEALAIRCLARAAQGKPAEALPDCDNAVSRLPKSVTTRTNRGATLVMLQKYEEAIKELDEALGLDEKAPAALYARGIAKLKSGSTSSGKRDIDKAVSIDAAIAERMAKRGVAP